MDPVTAIGLVSSVISLVEFGTKLVLEAKEIRDSVDSTLEKNKIWQEIMESMKEVTNKLVPSTLEYRATDPGQQKLCELATKCRSLSVRILELLDEIKLKSKSLLSIYKSAMKAQLKDGEIKDLEAGLGDCRAQLTSVLIDLTR